jgi:hypothetical protein
MLNTTASHPQPLRSGQVPNRAKLARYYQSRAACCNAAAKGSFGPRRLAYQDQRDQYAWAAWELLDAIACGR